MSRRLVDPRRIELINLNPWLKHTSSRVIIIATITATITAKHWTLASWWCETTYEPLVNDEWTENAARVGLGPGAVEPGSYQIVCGIESGFCYACHRVFICYDNDNIEHMPMADGNDIKLH